MKRIIVFMKHNDCACLTIVAHDGEEVFESDGYLPEMGIFGGDQTEIEIDNETGKIIGWKPITQAELIAADRPKDE